MRFHILGRTFEHVGGGIVYDDTIPDAPRSVDVSAWSYTSAADLTDAQILALCISAILKGIL